MTVGKESGVGNYGTGNVHVTQSRAFKQDMSCHKVCPCRAGQARGTTPKYGLSIRKDLTPSPNVKY